MLTLLETQREIREAVLAAPSRALLDEVISDRLSSRRRINVYRNHFRVSLKTGLAGTFPATRKLVGENYFDTMASIFVSARPPRDSRLSRYGQEFPRFLSGRDELEAFPFAAEVARLEWTLAEISSAPDDDTVGWNAFQRDLTEHGGALSLRFGPAVVLFDCEWPAHEIRKMALSVADADAIMPLVQRSAPTILLLYRDQDGDACELALDEVSATVFRMLRTGRSVNQAARAVQAMTPGYPVADFLRFLFQSGLVAGLSPVHASTPDVSKEI